MKKLKVLIADGQMSVKQQLVEALRKNEQIEIVAAADNGREAYEMFERGRLDIVVFDLFLPIYDGYSLLDKMNKHGIDISTKLIMTTPLTNDFLVSEAFYRGVDYILTKPYDATIVANKIIKLYYRMSEVVSVDAIDTETGEQRGYSINKRYMGATKIDTLISDKLNEIGVPARLKGYKYIITAVKEVICNEEALEGVTKILYPDVAKKHNSTPQRVEKAIRHAIEVTWAMEGNDSFKQEFPYVINSGKARPTNSEFIAKLSQDIKKAETNLEIM